MPSTTHAVLGIDIGSSSAKAMVFTVDGQHIDTQRAKYNIIRNDDGCVEIEPVALKTAVLSMIEACTKKSKFEIKAVAIASVGEAIIPVDVSENALANAVLTADSRFNLSTKWWLDRIDEASLLTITGLPLRNMWSVNAMRFHLNNESYSEKIHRFYTIEDWIVASLGVVPKIAISQASRSMLFDRSTSTWSTRLMKIAGVSSEQLSDVVYPGAVIGVLPNKKVGLNSGTLVVSGGHDQFIAGLGCGASSNHPVWSSGTVDSVSRLKNDNKPNQFLPTYQVDVDLWIQPIPNLNSGQALAWLADLLQQNDFDELLTDNGEVDNLVFVPTLGTTGAPDFTQPNGGLLFGLKYTTTKSQIARAMVRGIVHETYHAIKKSGLSLTNIEAFNLAGGGSNSNYWNRLKSAVINFPVLKRKYSDVGCIGSAIVALQGYTGERPSVDRLNPVVDIFKPEQDLIDMLSQEYNTYSKLRKIAVQR